MLKENLKAAFTASKLYVKEVSAASGVKKGTIDNWLSAKSKEPRAIDLYAVCKAINITMEQALDGETGIAYVCQWVRNKGEVWELPPQIADIVDGLIKLDSKELDIIRGAMQPMLKEKEMSPEVDTKTEKKQA